MAESLYWYTAYGLTFASELAVPELLEVEPSDPDVRITLQPVPSALPSAVVTRPMWSASEDEWLMSVPSIGRFHVAAGSRIAIERWGSDREVRAFLLGSTIAALMHQRRLLTLHASSFLCGRRAVVIAGKSGAGKSTTLAALVDRGHKMITDDKTGLLVDDAGRLVAIPGHPTIRLWSQALVDTSRTAEPLPPVRDGSAKVQWRAPDFHDAAVEVGAVFLLRKGSLDAVRVTRLRGPAAFRAVLAATYRPAMVGAMGGRAAHFTLAARLAGQVPIHRIVRPATGSSVPAVVGAILDGAQCAGGA